MYARSDQQILELEMETGVGLEPDEQLPRLDSAHVVILPAAMVEHLKLGTLRSVAVPAKSLEEAEALAFEMINRVALPIYYGAKGREVRVVASTPLLPKAPKTLLIPLCIAGLIIFNTMLSSIAERKREIYIYNSLGLAPLHVGFLFLAEAMTYGLMGAIFGYIVGQGVATFLSDFGLLGSITLNYSGTQAVGTMVMVLVVVILSSLLPAYLAGKLATPSNEMTWRVPEPKGDVIDETLPFTVTGKTANGVMNFIYEYFDAHREGSIGHFATDHLRVTRHPVNEQELMGIAGTVWLAPFDLGVRQEIEMTVQPTPDEDVFGIELKLRRESGQVANWWKLNRVFLGDLRKQLLGWRKLKPERLLQYIAQAPSLWEKGG